MGGGGRTAGTQIKRRVRIRNLVLRSFSSLSILCLMYLALYCDTRHGDSGGWAWAVLAALLSIPALREFYRLARSCGARPFSAAGYVLGPLWILAIEWELSGGSAPIGVDTIFLIAAAIAAMLLQLTRRTNEDAPIHVAASLFGMVYCVFLPGLTLRLHHLELSPGGWPAHGMEFVVVCVFVSKVADVGALLIGSRWGRHKMIPRLSPGKTWEGAAGGLAFSLLLLQFMILTEPRMALAGLGTGSQLLLSFLLAAAGMAGDLIESAFKRGGGRKDAGRGIPGFGGMLDLIDSIIAAAPVMYLFLLVCGARQAP
ncbi:MAG: phosphatidate cytidylyltransferase [Planctomycetota bacterium]|nr:phosphatidate cytidylyltransferase [Planctomycetota bacterium]